MYTHCLIGVPELTNKKQIYSVMVKHCVSKYWQKTKSGTFPLSISEKARALKSASVSIKNDEFSKASLNLSLFVLEHSVEQGSVP